MHYFAGLTWLNRGRVEVVGRITRNFVGRYGINYAHSSEGDIIIAHRPSSGDHGLRAGGLDHLSRTNRLRRCRGPEVVEPLHQLRRRAGRGHGPRRAARSRSPSPVAQPERVRAVFDQLYERLAVEPIDHAQTVHDLEGLLLLLHAQRRTLAPGGARTRGPRSTLPTPAGVAGRRHRPEAGGCGPGGLGADLPPAVPPRHGSAATATCCARMTRAATLLAETRLPVGDIAAAVGMGDAFQFAKCFRRHHHVTPTAWRNEAQADGSTSTSSRSRPTDQPRHRRHRRQSRRSGRSSTIRAAAPPTDSVAGDLCLEPGNDQQLHGQHPRGGAHRAALRWSRSSC